MRELRLSLKTKWFEMTGPNGKTEDYREITPYWVKRLFGDGVSLGDNYFNIYYKNGKKVYYKLHDWAIDTLKDVLIPKYGCKKFHCNTMTLGYPKSTDTSRIKKYEHLGIEIGYGKEEWGAEPGKLYFIIKHGKPIIELEKEARNGN